MEDRSMSTHAIYGIVFAVIAIVALLSLVFVMSQAGNNNENIVYNVNINAVAPVVGTVYVNTSTQPSSTMSSFTPVVRGSTDAIYIRATVDDDNGCQQIDSEENNQYKVFLYRSGATCAASGDADNNNCYYADYQTADVADTSGVAVTGCVDSQDTDVIVDAVFTVHYYMDGTDATSDFPTENWVAKISLVDDESEADNNNSSGFEVDSTIALDVGESSVNWGSLARDGASVSSASITIYNAGNSMIDVTQTATSGAASKDGTSGDFSCTTGHVDLDNVKYQVSGAISDDTAYDAASLTMDATSEAMDLTISNRITDAAETEDEDLETVYMGLQIPTTEKASGTCTTTVNLLAVANS